MLRAHTVEEIRAAEAALLAGQPEGALMQRAAHGLAHAVLDWLGRAYGARVLLLVGAGDNGGDALYAGAVLARRGVGVEAVLLDPGRAHATGLAALLGAGGRIVAAAEAAPVDVVVDGIVGIGASGGLRDAAVAALAHLTDVPVVAVDVPSGVEVDSGEIVGPHVRADLTVTFGTHRVAHLVDPAAAACGSVHLVDLGLSLPPAGVEALQAADVAALIVPPDTQAQKYSRGVVGVRAGSARYPGAAVLSVAGAGCGLAGMVRYDGSAGSQVLAVHPETVTGAGQVQAWVVGSGGGDEAAAALADSVGDDVPVVVDADALAAVTGPLAAPTVLTPHVGELSRMLGVDRQAVEAAPLRHARAAADQYAATVLLKGRRTLVAEPGGRVRVNTTGVPWLATAGAGDVLGGLVGALLAAGLSPLDAASAGAWLHGAAATLASAGGPLRAGEIARFLPSAVRTLRRSTGLPG
ncbi:MAG: bifunctional ADP-dependent NAD(P)H-hydrate dehydratase/NAD(P)H-hydrate epimerase [Nocardioides sp.]